MSNGPQSDWMQVLHAEVAASNQTIIARRIGRSASLLCSVLKGTYNGDLSDVEKRVRGAFMAETVTCPVVGELASDACSTHQQAPWAPHNPQRIMFYRACRSGCSHSRVGGQGC